MKRKNKLALAPAFALLFLLASCGGKPSSDLSALQIAETVADTQYNAADMVFISFEDDDFPAYLSEKYGLETGDIADGAVIYAGGTSADEIVVLLLNSGADTGAARSALKSYVDSRIALFYGYMPDEVYLLEQAVMSALGNYIALFVCDDPALAENTFRSLFDDKQPGDDQGGPAPDSDDYYDPDEVLLAWQTGDEAALSDLNARVLAAAREVIDEVVSDSMSAYEKELAVHDWIIDHVEYDVEALSDSPDAQPDPNSDNPYGVLINRRAICSGYTSTFQLFMDMLDIECITVEGTAYDYERVHEWNMVRLDGEWYCVDVTWNDPVGSTYESDSTRHAYFNVTSRFMRDTEHFWDDDSVPEATATTYSWA